MEQAELVSLLRCACREATYQHAPLSVLFSSLDCLCRALDPADVGMHPRVIPVTPTTIQVSNVVANDG